MLQLLHLIEAFMARHFIGGAVVVNVLFVGGSGPKDAVYAECVRKLGHTTTYVEATDVESCSRALNVLRQGDFDIVVVRNLRGMISDFNRVPDAAYFATNISGINKPVIVFDTVAANLAHRLKLQFWPQNVRIEEACTQVKENSRRIANAIRESLSAPLSE